MKHHTTLASLFVTSLFFNASLATAQQCSLDEISTALNGLSCEVTGAYVSVGSLVKGVTGLCESAPSEESCHECFRKSREKVKISVKTLVKLKLLSPPSLLELKPALREAEDATCVAIGVGDGEDSPEGYDDSDRRSPEDENRSRGRRGRGRGTDDTSPEHRNPVRAE